MNGLIFSPLPFDFPNPPPPPRDFKGKVSETPLSQSFIFSGVSFCTFPYSNFFSSCLMFSSSVMAGLWKKIHLWSPLVLPLAIFLCSGPICLLNIPLFLLPCSSSFSDFDKCVLFISRKMQRYHMRSRETNNIFSEYLVFCI